MVKDHNLTLNLKIIMVKDHTWWHFESMCPQELKCQTIFLKLRSIHIQWLYPWILFLMIIPKIKYESNIS